MVMKRRLVYALEVLIGFFSIRLTQKALKSAEAEPLIRRTMIKYKGFACNFIPL
jgi:hypothetical protein